MNESFYVHSLPIIYWSLKLCLYALIVFSSAIFVHEMQQVQIHMCTYHTLCFTYVPPQKRNANKGHSKTLDYNPKRKSFIVFTVGILVQG